MAEAEYIAGQPPTSKRRKERIGRLNTPGQIRAEIAKLYRQAKWGEIEINKGSKLASILAVGLTAAKIERDDEVERRLSEIESSLAHEADLDERDGRKVLPFALRART